MDVESMLLAGHVLLLLETRFECVPGLLHPFHFEFILIQLFF